MRSQIRRGPNGDALMNSRPGAESSNSIPSRAGRAAIAEPDLLEDGYQIGQLPYQQLYLTKRGASITDEPEAPQVNDARHGERHTNPPRRSAVPQRRQPRRFQPTGVLARRPQESRLRYILTRGIATLILGGAILYILVFALFDLGWMAVHHWQYGTFPSDQTSIVSGYQDSSLEQTQIQASSMNGQLLLTILPGGNLKKAVILAGPIVGNNAIVTLTPKTINGKQSKIDVQILTPPSLFNWNPSPITCSIEVSSQGFTLVRA